MLVISILQFINSEGGGRVWGGVGWGPGGGDLVYLQKVVFCVNVF